MATLDTKGKEVAYLCARIRDAGADVVVVDAGILGNPTGVVPDVTAHETAQAAGTTLQALRAKGTRGHAIGEMLVGLRAVTERLYQAGRISGAISLGGAEGGVMAAAAMQALPPGFPKLIVTPLASGMRPFGPFIGIRDITVMYSLIDIAGLNEISCAIFDNAAAAIAGMARSYRPLRPSGDRLVAITSLGTTERAMRSIDALLKANGFTPVVFHSSGIGGQVMEDMIVRGLFCGVIDLCPNELTDHYFLSYHDAGPNRLEAAGAAGLPQVVSVGCMDFFCLGPKDGIPDRWRGRPMYYHNPQFTLVRPTGEEMREIAGAFCQKLNAALGPVRVVLPLKGMSISGLAGGSTHDPEGDATFFAAIKAGLRPEIPVIELAADINADVTARTLVEEFLQVVAPAAVRPAQILDTHHR